jgi:hypothetical protein
MKKGISDLGKDSKAEEFIEIFISFNLRIG